MARAVMSDRFVAGARIGDYQVEDEIAIDATSVIYLGTHVVLPRQAYIKVPHPGSRPAAVQLLREACIHEALSHAGHAGIPRVYECGVLVDRRPWCALEVMLGVTLKQLVGAGPLALPDLVVLLRDVADILRHAHERGVVHRRLTLGAIVKLQRRYARYGITDWSDARTLDAEADVVVHPKDDIHTLGTIAFRVLTGTLPDPIDGSVGTYCPSAPAELIALIDQMLAEPRKRPAADEVFDRAVWLGSTLEAAPVVERPRWAPPHRAGAEGGAVSTGADPGGFAIRISRMKSR
ncbi:MAG TPA: hypothetical protein VHN14_00435 [Kofleriaceae bacterium]|jgi:hypothetical protein|nr:hypothetical protein [Kofleriaceae bacterium]